MLKARLQQLEESCLILLLVLMTLLVFLDVVMRFGFGTGWLWSQELTLYLAAWFVLFGLSYGLKIGAHINVNAFVNLCSAPIQRVLAYLAISLCLLYCGLIIYGAWVYLAKMYLIGITVEDLSFPFWLSDQLTPEIANLLKIDQEDPLIPLWLSQSILLFGIALFALRLSYLFIAVFQGTAVGFYQQNEADEGLKLAKTLQKNPLKSTDND